MLKGKETYRKYLSYYCITMEGFHTSIDRKQIWDTIKNKEQHIKYKIKQNVNGTTKLVG